MGNKPPPEWVTRTDSLLLDAFVDNPYECPIVIDKEGIIRFMSRHNTLEKGYVVPPEEAVGKHITEVVKNTRMPEVLKTGKAEIGKTFFIGERQRIIARIPLKDADGNVIGVLGKLMFHQTEKIKDMYRRIEILEGQVQYYRSEVTSFEGGRHAWEKIIGESKAMVEAKKYGLQAATSDAAALITGESGTGKELFAQAIHQNSRRAEGPFIKVNCAAIPHELIESEIFGYEGGAFTGARARGKPGKFELADHGTIFLDEIGDMPLPMQAKLLRVLQEHEVERIGATKSTKLDFRVIAATNQDLGRMIKEAHFRSDLFYRLNIFHIRTPSLREMPEDIPRIAYYLLSNLREKRRLIPNRISPEAMALFKQYSWPGNVRELKNALERAMNIAEGHQISVDDLPDRIRKFYGEVNGTGAPVGLLRNILADAEKRAIVEALRFTAGNKAKAARILGMHRTGLYQKLKRYGVEIQSLSIK
jgi:transcriptional regulator with PAS, ATPase and Fis domain